MEACLEYLSLMAEYRALHDEYHLRAEELSKVKLWEKRDAIIAWQELGKQVNATFRAGTDHTAAHGCSTSIGTKSGYNAGRKPGFGLHAFHGLAFQR